MLVLTIAVIIILFILSYIIFDKDLLAPPTAVALVFLFGSLCCFYNEKRWGLEFSEKTLGLIATGIIATIVGGYIGVVLSNFPKSVSFGFSHIRTEAQEIVVHPFKTYIMIVLQVVALVLVATHIRRLTGMSNVISAVGTYRLLTGRLADVNDLSIRMPIITKNLAQVSKMIGIVYAYIVGNNLIASKKKLSINWLPVFVYSITTFIQGDRSNMIREWIIILVVAYTIHKRSVGWRNNRETKKIIRRIALSVVILGALFSGVRELVGRTSDLDPLSYVTFYAGSPMAVLDQFWRQPIEKPEIWGRKTFFYLNESLTALIGWPGRYNYYSQFYRSPTGASIGNAPTALRDPYTEFGIFGFFIIFVLFGAFYTFLYCKRRVKSGNSPIDFGLLIYSYISYVFLMYFYASFNDFISHVFFKYMIELLLIRWFLVGWGIKRHVAVRVGRKSSLGTLIQQKDFFD